MTLSRRSTLLGMAGTAAGLCIPGAAKVKAQEITRGCLIDSRSFRQKSENEPSINVLREHLVSTTGNDTLDRALGRALVRMARLFDEMPGFGFYRGNKSSNAYASNISRIPGTQGTILFGRTLFEDLLRRYDDGGLCVLAIAAHEFGHIAQFSRNVDRQLTRGQPTNKRVELHADYLAGYYLGIRKKTSSWIKVRDAGEQIYRIGDYEFNNPDHHGTPDERVAAAETGFTRGYAQESFREAFSQGMRYVRKNA